MARREARLSFSVRIVPAPGQSEATWRRLLHEWEAHADEHALALEGTQLLWQVSALDRGLTEGDQVDLLDWLVDRPPVREVQMSALHERGDAVAQLEAGFVCLRCGDPCTASLTLLYRNRRLTASMYLQVLGGYMRPALR